VSLECRRQPRFSLSIHRSVSVKRARELPHIERYVG
jgi:hypothetical protein